MARRTTSSRYRLGIDPNQVYGILGMFYRAEVEARYMHLRTADNDLCRRLGEAVEWITNQLSKPGLMLKGGVGSGKTTLMRALALLLEYYNDGATYAERNERRLVIVEAKKIRPVHSETSLLAIDDLGTEPLEVNDFGNIITPMSDLLSDRYNSQRMTIVTTNLDADGLRQRYGERLYDRFREYFQTINFNNQSYRK